MLKRIEPNNRTINVVVYGPPDSGKTMSWGTFSELFDPQQMFLLDAERGLLSLQGFDIQGCSISSMADAEEAVQWLMHSNEAKDIKLCGVDSLTKVADMCLLEEQQKGHANKYKPYEEVYNRISSLVEKLKYIEGKHTYMTCRLDKVITELGHVLHGPDMPGRQLSKYLLHEMDLVCCQRVWSTAAPSPSADGLPSISKKRALQTGEAEGYSARNRTGVALSHFETINMATLFSKIAKGA